MKSNKVDFYYFSGTGNTFLVVREIKSFFEENRYQVNLIKLEKADPAQVNLEHTIGLAFPIAAFSTYPFVWNFLKSLPLTDKGTEIFMVTTMAGSSGFIIPALNHLLRKKGHDPFGAKGIIMPSNLNFRNPPLAKYSRIVEKGLVQARKFAHDLLFGFSHWKKSPFPASQINKFLQTEKPWQFMQKFLGMSIDTGKCIKCGLCYRLCPVENILMEYFPEFQQQCQSCMRCISFCPTEAIHLRKRKLHPYQAVKAEELI